MTRCPGVEGWWRDCDWLQSTVQPIDTNTIEAGVIGAGLLFLLVVAVAVGAFVSRLAD